jgi:hypothetical protein
VAYRAQGQNPATESINVADFGVAWGFAIVPEPSSFIMLAVGMMGVVVYVWRRKA